MPAVLIAPLIWIFAPPAPPSGQSRDAEAEQARIAKLVSRLDDDIFAVREAATATLLEIGRPAVPAIRKRLAASPSAEFRSRADTILAEVDWPDCGPAAGGLQLTAKPSQESFREGGTAEFSVRIHNRSRDERVIRLTRKGLDKDFDNLQAMTLIGRWKEPQALGHYLGSGLHQILESVVTIPPGGRTVITFSVALGQITTGRFPRTEEMLPAGTHRLRVVLTDDKTRVESAEFSIRVEKTR